MIIRILLLLALLGCPTAGVTGAGAGVDSTWEQRKLEARKMLENAAESPASSARCVGQILQNTFDFVFLPCIPNGNTKSC